MEPELKLISDRGAWQWRPSGIRKAWQQRRRGLIRNRRFMISLHISVSSGWKMFQNGLWVLRKAPLPQVQTMGQRAASKTDASMQAMWLVPSVRPYRSCYPKWNRSPRTSLIHRPARLMLHCGDVLQPSAFCSIQTKFGPSPTKAKLSIAAAFVVIMIIRMFVTAK